MLSGTLRLTLSSLPDKFTSGCDTWEFEHLLFSPIPLISSVPLLAQYFVDGLNPC